MATVCRCDKCNNYFLPDERDRVVNITLGKRSMFTKYLDNRELIEEKSYDLCQSCMASFNIWLSEGRK